MARPVSSNSVLEVTVRSRYQGSVILSVLHYRWQTATPTTINGDLVVDAAREIFEVGITSVLSFYKLAVNAGFAIQAVRYQWIYPTRYSYEDFSDHADTGTLAGDPLPSNLAAVIIKKSPYAGPHGVGSVHMSGLTTLSLIEDGSLLSVGYKSALNSLAGALDNVIDTGVALAGSTLVPVIYNKVNPEGSPQWNEHAIPDEPRVMRRRTLGVGI